MFPVCYITKAPGSQVKYFQAPIFSETCITWCKHCQAPIGPNPSRVVFLFPVPYIPRVRVFSGLCLLAPQCFNLLFSPDNVKSTTYSYIRKHTYHGSKPYVSCQQLLWAKNLWWPHDPKHDLRVWIRISSLNTSKEAFINMLILTPTFSGLTCLLAKHLT